MSSAAVERGGGAERGQLALQRGDLGVQHGRPLPVRLRLLGVAPCVPRRLALDAAQLAVRLGELPPRLLQLGAVRCRGELRLEGNQRRLLRGGQASQGELRARGLLAGREGGVGVARGAVRRRRRRQARRSLPRRANGSASVTLRVSASVHATRRGWAKTPTP